jgi:hypothetical protein
MPKFKKGDVLVRKKEFNTEDSVPITVSKMNHRFYYVTWDCGGEVITQPHSFREIDDEFIKMLNYNNIWSEING